MKLSSTLAKALNNQLNHELRAEYGYLAVAAYFDAQSLKGFGSWFHKQSSEEKAHAMKIYHYLLDTNTEIELQPIPAPTISWTSVIEAVQTGLKAEQNNTAHIHALYELAQKEKDIATQVFLNWFVEEQVEEEAVMQELIDRVRTVGGSGDGLLLLDAELGKRDS